jgi:hypothetical protein
MENGENGEEKTGKSRGKENKLKMGRKEGDEN